MFTFEENKAQGVDQIKEILTVINYNYFLNIN